MKDAVLQAIRSLPAAERTATTLFYINGYSQSDIASFLEVPVTTVKNRLVASRKRLKRRMMDMVEQTLHSSAPDERFNQAVIDKLLGGPRLLEIAGHPIREALAAIKAAMPNHEVICTEESIGDAVPLRMTQSALDAVREAGHTYLQEDGTILRTQMSWQALAAVEGRTPPVRLLVPGRVFNAKGWPEAPDVKTGHVCDTITIEPGHDLSAARAVIEPVIQAVLGPVDIQVERGKTPPGDEAPIARVITFAVKRRGQWSGVCRGGMLTSTFLGQVGFDGEAVGGSHFGFGLDRLAIVKLDLDNIRRVWQPPYVPA
jgi:phenylalanyl-tRNA synthetase alpha chain